MLGGILVADTFTAWNMSLHPIVKLEDDWNNMLAHGLEKTVSYIIRVNGSYIEGLKACETDGGTLIYGGVGNTGGADGTDAREVVQAVIDACEGDGGGTILFKRGTYTIDDGLVVDSSDVNLVGECQADCTIYLEDSSSIDALEPMLFIKQNGTIKFAVKNLTFDGNKAGNANGKGIVVGRDFSDATSDVLDMRIIEDVLVKNCAESGVCIGGVVGGTNYGACENPMLHRVTAWRNGGHGFIILASDGIVSGCYAGQNEYSGFHIKGTAYMFSDCKAYGNNYSDLNAGEAGFYIYNSDCWGNMFSNCQSDTNLGHGFLLYCDDALTGVNYNTFVGCQAWDNSYTDSTPAYSGFKLDTLCKGNKFVGCVSAMMRDTNYQKYGWEFSGAGCTDNALIGCDAGTLWPGAPTAHMGYNTDDTISWGGGALWYENSVVGVNEGYFTQYTPQSFWVTVANNTTDAFECWVDGETNSRTSIRPGAILFGSGAAGETCNLYYNAANQLITDDQLVCTDGIVTKVKAGALGDGDFTVDTDGLIGIDSTNNRIYYRYGGGWHFAAGDAGFQIREDELTCSLCRNIIGLGEAVVGVTNRYMSDGALHADYVHLKCVVKQQHG